MDIHKPKPWHGVREFLKEYVIIVVGVLTALAAEQGVEWLHWRHLAEKAEADLVAGMRPNLVNAYTLVVIESCGRARVAELAAALQKPGPDWRASPMPAPGHYTNYVLPQAYLYIGRLWSHAAWDTALASGVLNHMPRDRVARYADIYRVVDTTSGVLRGEAIAVSHLAPLVYDRKLTDAEKAHYLEGVAELDVTTVNLAQAARNMLQSAHALGLDPSPEDVAGVLKRQHEGRGACVTDVKLPLS